MCNFHLNLFSLIKYIHIYILLYLKLFINGKKIYLFLIIEKKNMKIVRSLIDTKMHQSNCYHH